MTVMGIDPSMRSTGICLNDGTKHRYFLVLASPTKKVQKFENDALIKLIYTPTAVKDKTSVGKEWAKTDNVEIVASMVEKVIYMYKPDLIVMEAVAFAAAGRVEELAGLNYAIRLAARGQDIPIYVVPPTTNKLAFTGNGQATKEMMVASWMACDPNAKELINIGKSAEDLADAYSLCHFPQDKLSLV